MSVVTEASCSSIIGVGNYSGGFQTGGNGSMSEREIEHPGECPCQLVRKGFDWDAVWVGSTPWVHCYQSPPDLMCPEGRISNGAKKLFAW